MSSPSVTVVLQRAHPSQSWGFRLQGGRDFREELSVKKVMPNTPAQGQLNAGDAILAIGGYDATQLTHAQAAQIIRNSTNQLQMTLAKGHLKTLKPSGPIKFSAGAAAGYGRPY